MLIGGRDEPKDGTLTKNKEMQGTHIFQQNAGFRNCSYWQFVNDGDVLTATLNTRLSDMEPLPRWKERSVCEVW